MDYLATYHQQYFMLYSLTDTQNNPRPKAASSLVKVALSSFVDRFLKENSYLDIFSDI